MNTSTKIGGYIVELNGGECHVSYRTYFATLDDLRAKLCLKSSRGKVWFVPLPTMTLITSWALANGHKLKEGT